MSAALRRSERGRMMRNVAATWFSLLALGLLHPALAHTPIAATGAAANDPAAMAPAPGSSPRAAEAAPLAPQVIGSPNGSDIVTVRPVSQSPTRQGLGQFVGIAAANSGARGLSMNRVVIPAGGRARAHRHVGSESAIYLLAGTVKTYYGPCLERSVVNHAGDFLFIPPGVPHMPVNLSGSEAAVALVARNDANEQEQVELIDLSGPAERSAAGCRPLP